MLAHIHTYKLNVIKSVVGFHEWLVSFYEDGIPTCWGSQTVMNFYESTQIELFNAERERLSNYSTNTGFTLLHVNRGSAIFYFGADFLYF